MDLQQCRYFSLMGGRTPALTKLRNVPRIEKSTSYFVLNPFQLDGFDCGQFSVFKGFRVWYDFLPAVGFYPDFLRLV